MDTPVTPTQAAEALNILSAHLGLSSLQVFDLLESALEAAYGQTGDGSLEADQVRLQRGQLGDLWYELDLQRINAGETID